MPLRTALPGAIKILCLALCNCIFIIAGQSSLALENGLAEKVIIPGFYGDRLTVYGTLFRPRQVSKPWPVVILLHGGFYADSSEWLEPEGGLAEKLFQADYMVLALDVRGSKGYGRDFAKKDDLGLGKVQDLLSGLRFLKGRSEVDSSRIALIGASRGAALALRAAEETDAIKLVVGFSSVVDYRYFYCRQGCANSSPEGNAWCQELRAKERVKSLPLPSPGSFCPKLEKIAPCLPWEPGCQVFEQGSPLLHLSQLRTPVLLHHGESDATVVVQDVQAFALEMDRLKLPHQLFVYSTEEFGPAGHAFLYPASPDYNPAAAELAWSRTMRALDYYLKGKGFRPW